MSIITLTKESLSPQSTYDSLLLSLGHSHFEEGYMLSDDGMNSEESYTLSLMMGWKVRRAKCSLMMGWKVRRATCSL